MGIKILRNRIIDIVAGLEVSLGFAETYYEMPTDVVSTPAVAVLTQSGSEELATTTNNELTVDFTVRCMVEKTDSADQDKTQTDKLLDLVDGIMTELRQDTNTTLSGDAFYLKVSGLSGITVGSVGNTIVFYLDVTVEAKTVVEIC